MIDKIVEKLFPIVRLLYFENATKDHLFPASIKVSTDNEISEKWLVKWSKLWINLICKYLNR